MTKTDPAVSAFVRRDRKALFATVISVSTIISVRLLEVMVLEKIGPVVDGFIGKRLIATVASLGPRSRHGSLYVSYSRRSLIVHTRFTLACVKVNIYGR